MNVAPGQDHRVVMITGAAGNLGRAVADAFAERSATLVLVGRDSASLAERYGPEDERRLFASADLSSAQSTAQAVEAVLARCARIDVLCNIAGGFRMGTPVHETADDAFGSMWSVNVATMLHAVAAVVPGMVRRGKGKIVNVGALGAQKGAARMGAYIASKAAVIRLTESMAAELREQGINVNCVLPSTIDTPENRKAMPDADPQRWVAPADLARVIAFLASDDARAIHGAAIPVTGLS